MSSNPPGPTPAHDSPDLSSQELPSPAVPDYGSPTPDSRAPGSLPSDSAAPDPSASDARAVGSPAPDLSVSDACAVGSPAPDLSASHVRAVGSPGPDLSASHVRAVGSPGPDLSAFDARAFGSPSSVDVAGVASRLPGANVVLTGWASPSGTKGFTFPPLPGRAHKARWVVPAPLGGVSATSVPAASAPERLFVPPVNAGPDAEKVAGAMISEAPENNTGAQTGRGRTTGADLPADLDAPAVGSGAGTDRDGELSTAPPVGPDAAPEGPGTEPAGVPVSPAPVGAPLEVVDLPSGDALGAEIAAELSAQAPPSAQAAPRRAEAGEWRGIVLVTGTDTDVGKTIATAAIAAAAQASGLRVAVIKPGQTGTVTGAPTDIEVISRLAAPDTARTLAEYPEPMAPLAAATVAELPPLELYEVVDAIRAEADKHDLVLVEGAGGLLVPMGVRPSGEPWTVADLATTLGVSTIVVARAGLGTLNHTALTLEALARRGVPAGVIIGAWPAEPELVHWANLGELVPHLVGALPEGAGRMDPGVFRRSAPGWLTPALYGVLDNWRVWADEAG
jgi:dethiobiotin synthase